MRSEAGAQGVRFVVLAVLVLATDGPDQGLSGATGAAGGGLRACFVGGVPMRIENWLKAAVLLAALLGAAAHATVARVVGGIDNVLVSDGFSGGCAARLAVAPSTEGLDCSEPWVAFNCAAETEAERQDGLRMFDSAVMAFALEKRTTIWVDDGAKVGDYCFGNRIDVHRN